MSFHCRKCGIHFEKASVAFRHLAVEHADDDAYTKFWLAELFEEQFKEMVSIGNVPPSCPISTYVGDDFELDRPATPCGKEATIGVIFFKGDKELTFMCPDHAAEPWYIGD